MNTSNYGSNYGISYNYETKTQDVYYYGFFLVAYADFADAWGFVCNAWNMESAMPTQDMIGISDEDISVLLGK